MSELLFCIKCGDKFPDAAVFCGKCGTARNVKANKQVPTKSEPIDASTLGQVPVKAAPKKNLALIISLAAVGFLVVVTGGIAAFLAVQQSSPSYTTGYAAGEEAALDQWATAWWSTTEEMCADKRAYWTYDNESDFMAGCIAGYDENTSDY